MQTRRGPDYAHDLTESERRTLDTLVRRVTSGVPAPTHLGPPLVPRRRPRPLLLNVAAAAVVLLVIVSIRLLAGPPHQPTPPADASATLGQLAAAAAAAPAGPAERRTTEILVVDPARSCTVSAVTTTVTSGHLTIRTATAPPGVAARAGCSGGPRTDPAPRPSFDRDTADPDAKWTELRASIPALPPWVATVDAGTDLDAALRRACALRKVTDCTATWWTLLTDVLAGPGPIAERAEALRLASDSGQANAVPSATTDVTGRAGVTVRVPYADATRADLTFDPDTGALLQRAVVEAGRSTVRFTVYWG